MDVVLPDLGEVDEVKLVRWLVGVGDRVAAGQAVAEVEADKAVFVVESPAAGTVARLLVPEGGMTRPGEAIAQLGEG
ncbi:MAG: hypothetical protein N2320_03390 [Candidatus Bipolaricaulota bacterium]|nr:hypothetical protein [Candidatus Bipolaricaulota bacterium]